MNKAEIDAERINWLVKTFGEVSIGRKIDFLRWMDEQTADRDKWRDRCERLIGHYTDDAAVREDNDYGDSFAQQIQKEIDDEIL